MYIIAALSVSFDISKFVLPEVSNSSEIVVRLNTSFEFDVIPVLVGVRELNTSNTALKATRGQFGKFQRPIDDSNMITQSLAIHFRTS